MADGCALLSAAGESRTSASARQDELRVRASEAEGRYRHKSLVSTRS